ncbi:putative RNA-binding protein with PUA-like domain [Azorhizobium sp. AG788]|uniref:EVE domain-containing protein n=1 Tax=Azorhizobium sp. AG788 TaxID=2183897 RepID=UPI00105BCF0E|nr:EVE domain-containing protein [Azorhizobium sp. AG788]TDT96728.1 putative RNA-binding protein with PUA-like domain [Azorhizobium sp. AG788]
MAHWLYKSEPFKWSWDQQAKAGAKGTHWDGVRNHLAKQQLQAMKLGDQGFFYHSNEGKEIVGIVEVIREFYPDPSDATGKFGMVDLKAVRALKKPVTLATIKAEPRLENMALIKFSRLSVQPVTDEEWDIVLSLAEG